MKKLILLSAISCLAFADCNIKLEKLERELSYAKKYNNYNRVRGLERAIANVKANCYHRDYRHYNDKIDALEDEAESKIDAIEDRLDELNDAKDTMSKAEYKKKKAELKAEKKRIKREYKAKKRELLYK